MKNSREENSEIVEKIKSELENQETLKSHDMQITLKRNASSATAERLFHF